MCNVTSAFGFLFVRVNTICYIRFWNVNTKSHDLWLLIAWRREQDWDVLWVIETCDCAYQITFSFNHGCLCLVCDSLLRLSIVLITVPRNMDIKIAILVVLCLHCTGTLIFVIILYSFQSCFLLTSRILLWLWNFWQSCLPSQVLQSCT